MIWVIVGVAVLAAVFGPQLWVRYVLARHSEPRRDFPGTGGELARHLLDEAGLGHVPVETTEVGDHYDPEAPAVRLTADHHDGRSLTAVVVAAHEVGHAIQHKMRYRPLTLRTRLAKSAHTAQRLGLGLLLVGPLIAAMVQFPQMGALTLLGGFLTLGTAVVVHFVTLPVEWDASFNKALPILFEGRYLEAKDHRAARSILTACALTYVAAALASLLNVARWLAILRR